MTLYMCLESLVDCMKQNLSSLTYCVMLCCVMSCRYVLHCRFDMLWPICDDFLYVFRKSSRLHETNLEFTYILCNVMLCHVMSLCNVEASKCINILTNMIRCRFFCPTMHNGLKSTVLFVASLLASKRCSAARAQPHRSAWRELQK